MSHSGTIRWLRECYRADRSRVGVRDFYGGDVKMRQMVRDEERLLTGVLEEEVLSPSYGEKAFGYAALYRREREVVYGALFVCGKRGGKLYRAPLVLYEAVIFSDGGYFSLRVDASAWRLNPVALLALDGGKEFEFALLEVLRDGVLDEGVVGSIRRLVLEFCVGVDCDSLLKWPYLEKSKVVDEAGGGEICVMAASGIGNVVRSVGARGVLDEMEKMVGLSGREYSGALNAVFDGSSNAGVGGEERCLFVPATLSMAQENILRSARKNVLTVCHGPPGTGKSFTIAAIALDHVSRGESVLVASGGDHAVDVMHGKIDAMLDGEEATVRAGRKEHLRELTGYLELCLTGHGVEDLGLVNLAHQHRLIERKIGEIEKAERQMEEEFETALSRGKTLAEPNDGWVARLKRFWIGRSVRSRPLLCELSELLESLHQEREGMVREYGRLERKCRLLETLSRKERVVELRNLLKGLKKRRGSEQEAILKEVDYGVVLKIFPIWLTKFEDAHRVLPLKKELFDVVIIDEASQCDLASVLPILQRAKRVVVAGDTKQLRHVCFLAVQKMVDEAREAGVSEELLERLNYRDRSLMDVAAECVSSLEQTGFLDEHFRSEKLIIGFSNDRFYRGALKVMREKPWLEGSGNALVGERVAGVRGGDGVNAVEVKAVLKRLREIDVRERSFRLESKTTVGVLSPFRAQVDAISEAVREKLGADEFLRLVRDHALLIGTAHRFQGEERDLMMISWCVDGDSGPQVLRFLEREDVFNVSVTRARLKQVVVHSVGAKKLPAGSLLGDYLRYLEVAESKVIAEQGCTDVFAKEVAGEFFRRGVKIVFEGVVAGMEVDMLLQKGRRELGVDLVGYPGQMTKAVAQRKAQMIGRAGMKLVPLGYAEWVNRREECVERLMGILNRG